MSTPINHNGLDQLLDYLRSNRGFDFTGYKRNTLARRINVRMQMVEIASYSEYLDYLEVHPEEYAQLFNAILINVTGFFRDPEAWDFIKNSVIPAILNRKSGNPVIRVWSAGCASGEEAYTMAILLAEAVGDEDFHNHVKIYATDLDDDALLKARQATYSEHELESVPPELQAKYFERSGNQYTFRKELRRSVIFGRHDLIQDAPISKIDLITYRNILMYFNAETQAKVLARLHFALSDTGYLFLGRAEMLLTHSNLFTPLNLKSRVFRKVPKNNLRDRLLIMAQGGKDEPVSPMDGQGRLRDIALDTGAVAQMLLDSGSLLTLINERARDFFGLTHNDIGRPFQDLKISYSPIELRSSVERATTEREMVILRDVPWTNAAGEDRILEIRIIPLLDNGGPVLGVNLFFQDITPYTQLRERLEHTNQDLETALEELQSTNEELETTNEELQSTIEELETTNEELQSTNEELETMNEELQATNEELETMNEEMRIRTDELNQVNAFMESILTSLHGGVVVIDPELRIQVWNRKSEDLWGLREEEVVGHNLFSLDIGLPIEQLKKPIRLALVNEDHQNDTVVNAINRRGKQVTCRVNCTPLFDLKHSVLGVIIVIQEINETITAK